VADWKSFADFGCPTAQKRWRYLADGSIEIEGAGTPVLSPWPAGIEQWRQLIEDAAARNGVPAAWVATIMAIETQGKNLCMTSSQSVCSGPGCACVPNEGAGLMATLPSTAAIVLARGVTSQQLLEDPALAIEAGTRYLKQMLDKYQGDFVAAAVAYNAGSVRCGRGGVWVPAGQTWPKQACPDTGWGVVFGCVYSQQSGPSCGPSGDVAPMPYICSTVYPEHAIAAQNAARQEFGGVASAGIGGTVGLGMALLAGAAAGWYFLADRLPKFA